MGVIGVELGSEQGAAFGIEAEGWTVVAEILGPELEGVARVGEFEDAGMDDADGGGVVGGWWQKRELLQIRIGEMSSTNLVASAKIEG